MSSIPIHRFGENLRILLSQPTITASDLDAILRHRGIRVAQRTKEEMIPLLTGSLLTSLELENLQSLAIARELRSKVRTRTFQTEDAISIPTIVSSPLQISDLEPTGQANYRIVSISPFTKAKDRAAWGATIEIERLNLGKNWAASETRFKSEIEVTSENHDTVVTTQHQSKESEDVARRAVSAVRKRIKSESAIKSEKRIVFSDFTAENRIQFFLAFAGLNASYINFARMTDVGIAPGAGAESVPELEWMSDQIHQLKLKGDSLQDLQYLAEKRFHKYINIFSSQCTFNFSGTAGKGRYDIIFEFSGAKRDDSEFEFSVKSMRAQSDTSSNQITKIIHQQLDAKKREFYDKFRIKTEN